MWDELDLLKEYVCFLYPSSGQAAVWPGYISVRMFASRRQASY